MRERIELHVGQVWKVGSHTRELVAVPEGLFGEVCYKTASGKRSTCTRFTFEQWCSWATLVKEA